MHASDRVPVIAFKRHSSGRGAIERDAERVQIAATVKFESSRLFGTEVMRRAHDVIAAAQCRFTAQCTSQTEIGNDRLAMRTDEDVVGLDVAMHHAARMRDREGGGDIESNPDHFGLGEPLQKLQSAREGKRQQVHRHKGSAIDLADVSNRHDVRVSQSRGDGGFSPETRLSLGLPCELWAQDLQRDRDLQVTIDRLVDPRESPSAEQSDDPIFSDLAAEIAIGHVTVLYRRGEVV